jgi:hypothetical protein
MKIQRQLTVFLENQPGMMDRICLIMREAQINILAFTLFGTVDHGVLRMIVDKPLDALHSLGQQGILVIDTEVIEVDASNVPGALEEITGALSKAKVNVEYGYGSTGINGGKERFFLQVSNTRKALLAIKNRVVKNSRRAARKVVAEKPKKKPAAKKTAKKVAKKAPKKSSRR